METITSRRNVVAGHLRRLGVDREYRYEQGEFLCDGIRLLREAVSGGCAVTAVFTASEEAAHQIEREMTLRVYTVTADIMNFVSPLKNPQGVLFSCKMPKQRELDTTAHNIVLDGIQDPGNVGTIMRAACAFGIDSVVLCGASADPYNPKTVRATMGAIFRQNFVQADYNELSEFVKKGMTLFGAALGEGSVDIREVSLKGASIAIGSEGAGLSDEALSLCRRCVIIPMEPEAESLNAGVAASIFMWMMYGGSSNVDA